MLDHQEWRPSALSTGSWVLYDLANTVFSLGVGALYFADWLNDNRSDLPGWVIGNDTAELALALALNAAMVVVIVLGPWIGARSDHRGSRRRYLVPMTLLCIAPTFFLATASVSMSLVLFALALVGFNLGGIVYDAMLPDVSTPQTLGRVSGIGIGVGYLGSVIAVVLGALILDQHGHAAVFRMIAILFLVLALPSFFLIRERPHLRQPGPPPALRKSFVRLYHAWKRARTYPGVTRFLVGRFLYTDAVNTLIGGYLTIYVKEELGFTTDQVQALLGVAIAGAIVGGLAGGVLVDRYGPRRLLHLVLYAWIVAFAVAIAAGAASAGVLGWLLGGLGGMALGSLWASDRAYMARISPPRHLGEFYGLYATMGRFATIVGPLMFGLIVTVLGWPRELAMAVLMLFVVAGRLVLRAWMTGPGSGPPPTVSSEARSSVVG